jgi:hypothetical protein
MALVFEHVNVFHIPIGRGVVTGFGVAGRGHSTRVDAPAIPQVPHAEESFRVQCEQPILSCEHDAATKLVFGLYLSNEATRR